MIDYSAWKFWFDVLQLLGTLALGIYVWWSNREKVTARRFATLEREVAVRVTAEALKTIEGDRLANCKQHDARTKKLEMDLTRIDSNLKHMPSHDDLSRIHSRIDEVHGSVREQTGLVKGIDHQVTMILEAMVKS